MVKLISFDKIYQRAVNRKGEDALVSVLPKPFTEKQLANKDDAYLGACRDLRFYEWWGRTHF